MNQDTHLFQTGCRRLTGSKFRYPGARLTCIRLERKLDEDDMLAEDAEA